MKHLGLMLLCLACSAPAALHAAPTAAAPAAAAPVVAPRHAAAPVQAPKTVVPHTAIHRPVASRPMAGAIGGPAKTRPRDHGAKTVAVGGAPQHTSSATAAISGSDTGHGH